MIAGGAIARVAPAKGLPALRRAVASSAQAAIADKGSPGVSVAVAKAGRLLLADGFGLANLETGTPVDTRSVFRIGSLTKQFTAAAIVQLSGQGQLRLSDPLATYLPAFAPFEQITLSELMHHTAGLRSDDEAPIGPSDPAEPSRQVVLADAIAHQTKLFDFPPGSAWLYSNANYIALGAVVEKVSGKTFAAALEDLVLGKLGRTSLKVDRSDAVVPFRASGYSLAASGFSHAPFVEIGDAGGAGAMRGTASDVVRWHQALISRDILSGEGLKLLLTPGRLRDGRLSSTNLFSANDVGYGQVQYGGGLLLSPDGEHPRTISHNGFINGFSAMLETNLDSGLSFCVLANADVGPNLPFRAIRRAVRTFEHSS